MKIRPLLTIPVFLTIAMCFGFVVAWASTHVLKFGYPFSNRFPYTSINMPDEEVEPMLTAFVFVLGAATAFFIGMFRRIALRRPHAFAVLVEIAFGLAVFVTQTTVDRPPCF